jgi:hypothetical protein
LEPVYYTMGWTTKIVLTNGGFTRRAGERLADDGSLAAGLAQPRYTNGTPCTNDLSILKLRALLDPFGPTSTVTGAKHLVAQGGNR